MSKCRRLCECVDFLCMYRNILSPALYQLQLYECECMFALTKKCAGITMKDNLIIVGNLLCEYTHSHISLRVYSLLGILYSELHINLIMYSVFCKHNIQCTQCILLTVYCTVRMKCLARVGLDECNVTDVGYMHHTTGSSLLWLVLALAFKTKNNFESLSLLERRSSC